MEIITLLINILTLLTISNINSKFSELVNFSSEIHLVIKGQGAQNILSDMLFYILIMILKIVQICFIY